MLRDDIEKIDFNNLPIEILIGIYFFLSPKDISSASLVSKPFNQAAKDNWLWMFKFSQHFSHLFSNLSHQNENNIKWKNTIDWLALHRDAHYKEYKGNGFFKRKSSTERNKLLFPLVKEGDIQRLKASNLSLSDLERCDINGITLLGWAKQKKYQYLLDYFFELAIAGYSAKDEKIIATKKDRQGRTILHWSILCHQSINILDKLILNGCQADAQDNSNKTPLHYAAQEGQEEMIPFFIAYRADVNARDITGSTPLLHSVKNGYKETVAILLLSNAKTSISLLQTNNEDKLLVAGDEPLHAAVKIGCKDIVEALLDNGANIHSLSLGNYTALHYAAKFDQAEIAELLVQRGADINARSNVVGVTPLLLATMKGSKNTVDVLLLYKANTSLALLQKHNLYEPLVAGDEPLHAAVKIGRKDIVEALLDNGVNINTPNGSGLTALYIASKKGFVNITELLISRGAVVDDNDMILKFNLLSVSLKAKLTLFNPEVPKEVKKMDRNEIENFKI